MLSKRIKVRTFDVDPRWSRNRDAMLTTNMRLNAEPANKVGPGDMGVCYDGTGGIPRQADVLFDTFLEGLNLLSPAEVSEIKARLMKYAASSSTTTSQVGITSNDSVRRGVEAVQSINAANKKFWDERAAADERRVFGGR